MNNIQNLQGQIADNITSLLGLTSNFLEDNPLVKQAGQGLLAVLGVSVGAYSLIAYLQRRTCKILGVEELVHPDYPKKWLTHTMKFSGRGQVKREFLYKDLKFLSDHFAHTTQQDKTLIWISPFFGRVINLTPKILNEIMMDSKRFDKAYNYKFLSLDRSVITVKSDEHKKIRAILQPGFSTEHLMTFQNYMNKHSKILMLEILQADSQKNPLNVYQLAGDLFLDITGESAFGFEFNALTSKNGPNVYSECVENFIKFAYQRASNIFYWNDTLYKTLGKKLYNRAQANSKILEKKMLEIMEPKFNEIQNDSNFKPQSIAEYLCFYYLTGKIDMQTLFDNCLIMMFAGSDTSANALACSLFLLGKHQDVQADLQKEIDSIFGGGHSSNLREDIENFTVEYEKLEKMKKLFSFVKETLRLYPSAPAFSRAPDRTKNAPLMSMNTQSVMGVLRGLLKIEKFKSFVERLISWLNVQVFD